jgi:hypothetical protein
MAVVITSASAADYPDVLRNPIGKFTQTWIVAISMFTIGVEMARLYDYAWLVGFGLATLVCFALSEHRNVTRS